MKVPLRCNDWLTHFNEIIWIKSFGCLLICHWIGFWQTKTVFWCFLLSGLRQKHRDLNLRKSKHHKGCILTQKFWVHHFDCNHYNARDFRSLIAVKFAVIFWCGLFNETQKILLRRTSFTAVLNRRYYRWTFADGVHLTSAICSDGVDEF